MTGRWRAPTRYNTQAAISRSSQFLNPYPTIISHIYIYIYLHPTPITPPRIVNIQSRYSFTTTGQSNPMKH